MARRAIEDTLTRTLGDVKVIEQRRPTLYVLATNYRPNEILQIDVYPLIYVRRAHVCKFF